MIITGKKTEDTLQIALKGRLDTATAPELDDVFRTSLDGIQELILDFSELDYISSAGLRVLLSAYKRMYGQGSMKILNINEIVREVFEVTGFDEMLNIE